jgi:hypothetical protein
MATTIVTKNGSGAPTASDLVAGELAVDLTNGRLYTENSGGTVLELGLNPSGNVNVTGTVTASSTLTAQKLVSTNGVLELDDNGSHNGVINSPASLFINIDSDGTNTGEDFVIGKDRTGTSGGTELFRVQEDGSVGIGTASPAALIHGMSGDLFLTANSTAADSGQGVFFQSTTSGWATSAAHAAIYGKRTDASNGYLRFDTRQSGTTQEAMRIDSAGNVDLYQGNNLTWRFAAGSTIRGSISVDSADNITFSNTSSNTERMRIDSSGNVGIGVVPSADSFFKSLEIGNTGSGITGRGAADTHFMSGLIWDGTSTQEYTVSSVAVGKYQITNGIHSWATAPAGTAGTAATPQTNMTLDTSGNLGIGTSTPSAEIPLTAFYSSTSQMHLGGAGNLVSNNTYFNGSAWVNRNAAVGGSVVQLGTDGSFAFRRAGTGASPTLSYSAVIDASGNLLVGKTSVGSSFIGSELNPTGYVVTSCVSDFCGYFNRTTTDGGILQFRKDNATVGSIGTDGGTIYFSGPSAGGFKISYYNATNATIFPVTTTGAIADGLHDIGYSASRFRDIYATNGTIQTSDRNEKQDIEALSDAEQRVAVAAKGLLRKFRWKSSVAEKGDEARTHFGIIAQDLQAAFEAEGLDAGDYAMFIHSTWTDEETGEERSRMGVRYSELLAFIIAAI